MPVEINEREIERQLHEVVLKIEKDIAAQIEGEAKRQVVQMDLRASLRLEDSFKTTVDERAPSVTFENDAPYAAAVNDGAKAHYPPWENLVEWVNIKLGLKGKEAERAAKGIAYHISKVDTAPRPFFSNAVQSVIDKLNGKKETT